MTTNLTPSHKDLWSPIPMGHKDGSNIACPVILVLDEASAIAGHEIGFCTIWVKSNDPNTINALITQFEGRHVITAAPADFGRSQNQLESIVGALVGVAASVRWVALPDGANCLADWVSLGNTDADFRFLMEHTRPLALCEIDDPPIVPIDDKFPPNISPDFLPPQAERFAREIAVWAEVPQGMVAMQILGLLASLFQRRYVITDDPGHNQPLSLYCAVAMDSGERKSSVQKAIANPLFRHQHETRKIAAEKRKGVMESRGLDERRLKALERQYAKTGRADDEERELIKTEIDEIKNSLPPVDTLPQTIVSDFTEAALVSVLQANNEASLLISSEGGCFDNMCGRWGENSVAEIDLILKCADAEPHTVNRISRDDPVFLSKPRLSIVVSPQPSVVASLGKKRGFIDRGLVARFIWLFPQSNMGSRRLEPKRIDVAVHESYEKWMTKLANEAYEFDGDPTSLSLSDEAYDLWKSFQREIEPRLAPHGDLYGNQAMGEQITWHGGKDCWRHTLR